MATTIHATAIVEAGAQLGADCEIQAYAIITRHGVLGDGVVVHPFAVVGGDPQYLKFDRAVATGVRIGAGTVMDAQQVRDVHAAGGQLIVSPHFDPSVVTEAKRLGMIALPGVATPSEAFAALRSQADGLKVFPSEMVQPAVLKAWCAVLPAHTALFPVGGIKPENMAAYRSAGASGFGIGSALFKPGMAVAEVHQQALRFRQAWTDL